MFPALSEQLALVGVVPRLASEAMTMIAEPAGALCVVVRLIDVADVLSARFEPSAAGEPIATHGNPLSLPCGATVENAATFFLFTQNCFSQLALLFRRTQFFADTAKSWLSIAAP